MLAHYDKETDALTIWKKDKRYYAFYQETCLWEIRDKYAKSERDINPVVLYCDNMAAAMKFIEEN